MSRDLSASDGRSENTPYQALGEQPEWVKVLLSGEEVAFTTQTLEGHPAPFTSCSAVTVHIKAGSNDGPALDNIDFRVTSRCGSLEGEVNETYLAVKDGKCIQLLDGHKAPVATIGHLHRGSSESMWLSGSLSVSLEEWWKYNEKGVFVGVLSAGDTVIEIFGATEAAFRQTSTYAKMKTVWHMIMMFFDPFLEINAASNFLSQGKMVQGILVVILAILAALQSWFELKREAHSNGRTILDFLTFNVKKTLHAGTLSHNLMLLKVNDIYECLILHSIVACGLLTDKGAFNFSTAVSVFGIFSAASEVAVIHNAFAEHYAQASRMKFEHAAPGKTLHALTCFCKGVCNPVFTLALVSDMLCESYPGPDLTLLRRTMITSIAVVASIVWYVVAFVIPHCIFLGGVRAPQTLTEICTYAFQCSAAGEAPVTVKRTSWSPSFHLYKLLISSMWTGFLFLGLFQFIPSTYDNLIAHLLPFLQVSSVHEFMSLLEPHSFLLLSWILAVTASLFCEVTMCIVAQTGYAYPGLRFGTPRWPVLGVEKWTEGKVDPSLARSRFSHYQ